MGDQNIFAAVLDKVRAANDALIADGVLPAGIDQSRIVVEPPRESAHGDMATNAAMVLAKDAERSRAHWPKRSRQSCAATIWWRRQRSPVPASSTSRSSPKLGSVHCAQSSLQGQTMGA